MTSETAPTTFVEAAAARFAFRRLGPKSAIPLILLQPFRGNLDNWDPAVVNGLAANRDVVAFDNRGVGGSSGLTPDNVSEMAQDAFAFLDALSLTRVDLLGFSLGGMVAQQMLFDRPSGIRRAILAGTGGPGALGMFSPEVTGAATRIPFDAATQLLLFFQPTTESQAAGKRSLERMLLRADREPAVSRQTIDAQLTAIRAWAESNGESMARLTKIQHPILIIHGTHDIVIPPVNAYTLSQNLPNAQLILYPDAGHGSLFQYPKSFVHDASRFLEGRGES